jgi:hypothetical protein
MNESPPDPITDEFNPSAWAEPTGLLSKLRTLVHYYVTYPIAQNYPITFTNLVFVTDATLTKMANTSYVIANLVPYLASLPPLSITWSAIQNFTGIQTNTINPIGAGTLTIGNAAANTKVEFATQTGRNVVFHLGDGPNSTGDIHIGNGLGSTNHIQILHAGDNGSSGVVNLGSATSTTNLYCPLTPILTYTASTLTIGTVNQTTTSGTPAGTIGHVIHRNMVNAYSFKNNAYGPITLSTGVWFLVGQYSTALAEGLNSDQLGIGLRPSNANITGMFAIKANLSGAQLETPRANGQECYMSTSSYVVVTGATQNFWLNISDEAAAFGIGTSRMYMRAVRVA